MTASYQIALIGKADSRATDIRMALSARLSDLGLDPAMVRYVDEVDVPKRDRQLPTVGLYFGDAAHVDSAVLADLILDSVVIVPIVTALARANEELPQSLIHINAVELGGQPAVDRIASLILETFRLLRKERRLFISYRRDDAQPFAEKLYDKLDARGFDVFIDVRSVPPAVDFQSELWHRLADSDVVVLIDTPGFRESRWTTAELARANATNVQILHLLWPGQPEDPTSAFSHFLSLNFGDFKGSKVGRGAGVLQPALERVCSEAERLRARAIAARYRYLVDNFCDCARDLGLAPAVQSDRWIAVQRRNGRTLAAVPAVGVPTSDRINGIFDAVSDKNTKLRDLWVIYDNRGLLQSWLSHLEWLNDHLPVRAVRMDRVYRQLKELDV